MRECDAIYERIVEKIYNNNDTWNFDARKSGRKKELGEERKIKGGKKRETLCMSK